VNCFTHDRSAAVGMCALCQKGICHECVALDTPRLVCRACAAKGTTLAYGFEYKSPISIGSWPLVHVCTGIDPVTLRPRIAKGVVAIGNIAVGGLAVGGLALGWIAVGGASLGLAGALGGAAVGLGISVGGFAVGSVAIGGAAVGFVYALGGGAIAPAVIDSMRCDEGAREFFRRWLGAVPLPPRCH
jgi:hypothetical protein